MRFTPTPGMALAVSLLALVIATTGSAVAAKSRLTGKDIKNGSITSADIAKGAIKSKQLARSSVQSENIADNAVDARGLGPIPTICPNGMVTFEFSCPLLPQSYASVGTVAFTTSLPIGGGVTCYDVVIPFTDGLLTSGNTWNVANPQDFTMRGGGGGALMTVAFVFENTQDATLVGGELRRLDYNEVGQGNGQSINVPKSFLQLPVASPQGVVGATLSYHFEDLLKGNVVRVHAFACSSGAVPRLKSATALLNPDQR